MVCPLCVLFCLSSSPLVLPVHRRRTRWSSFFVLFVFLSLLVCWPPFFFSFPASSPSLSHYLTRGALCFQRPVAPAALHCSPTFVPFVFCGPPLRLTEKAKCTVHSICSHVSIVGWVRVACVIFSGGFC